MAPLGCTPVGASLLAKVCNNNAGYLVPRVALRFFASKLAPTGGGTRQPCADLAHSQPVAEAQGSPWA
ncbi:hypothetical protein CEC48_19875 [Pseudomonas sp. K2I15]|nr:hypothetical protein CEC48_19875 [Pseudomonas sp. K2I15]